MIGFICLLVLFIVIFLKTKNNERKKHEKDLEAVKQDGWALEYVNEDNLIFLINHFKKLNYIDTLRWKISMIDDIVQVGCQKHSYKTWLNFSQDEISKMDDDALYFYNNTLFNLITDSYKDYK
jgi:hypothetical protein